MDTLNIIALQVSTTIGVHEWEKKIDQPLEIDIHIPLDLSTCQDQLEHTIDYALLCKRVSEYVASKSFQLIETVAEEVATLIQREFTVTEVVVTVHKPHAVKNTKDIQVTVKR